MNGRINEQAKRVWKTQRTYIPGSDADIIREFSRIQYVETNLNGYNEIFPF